MSSTDFTTQPDTSAPRRTLEAVGRLRGRFPKELGNPSPGKIVDRVRQWGSRLPQDPKRTAVSFDDDLRKHGAAPFMTPGLFGETPTAD